MIVQENTLTRENDLQNRFTSQQNPLYPIFIKLHKIEVLIVGAGEVGLEKLGFMLKSSPDANVTVVATWAKPEVAELIAQHSSVTFIQKAYEPTDVIGKNLIIAATCFEELNREVRSDGKALGILVNVADTPDLCDFYLGGIVTKGNLKIAISTNGKSPTFAKRMRQLFEEVLPDDIPQILNNLRTIRDGLKDDFEYKVKRMNEITKSLL